MKTSTTAKASQRGKRPGSTRSQQKPDDPLTRLRQKLGRKAKQEPSFRFYSLYGHLLRWDVLEAAYRRSKANKGCAGVDGVTFADIEASEGGRQRFLENIQESLRTRTYRPDPVLRVYIDKEEGGKRQLGIPTVRDRTVQGMVVVLLEPIFEADFEDCSYGFRPKRHQHMALDRVRQELKAGRTEVLDIDLSRYFDTIDHDRLMKCLERRISDRSLLKLIRTWLRCPAVEENGRGGEVMTKPKAGSPQGGPLSPLLSNVYLHEMDRDFHGPDGPAQFANAKLVRYADDFLVMARWMGPRIKRWVERKLEADLGLTMNERKTKIVKVGEPRTSLDFLSYTFRFDRSLKGRNKRYLNVIPSKKSMATIRERVRRLTRSGCKKTMSVTVQEVNKTLHDWVPYYRYGYPRKCLRDLNHYVRGRFRRFLRNRSQRISRPFRKGESIYAGLQRYGLVYL